MIGVKSIKPAVVCQKFYSMRIQTHSEGLSLVLRNAKIQVPPVLILTMHDQLHPPLSLSCLLDGCIPVININRVNFVMSQELKYNCGYDLQVGRNGHRLIQK
jgi:hypothetical protein